MKNLINLIVPLCIGGGLFSACANLEQVETTDLDKETVFADSSYTSGFLSQIYVNLGYDVSNNRYRTEFMGWVTEHGGLQTACDEAAYKVNSAVTMDVMFATGTINPVSALEDDVWKKAYENIRRANLFLANVDNCPELSDAKKKQHKAEARFLRAWYYAMLLRHYGGVPLIGDAIYTVDDAVNGTMKTSRDSYADCVDYIISECQQAAQDLPDTFSGNDNGRATRGACLGLISRVRLYAASPLYNGSDFGTDTDFPKELIGYPTYDKERWKLAVDAARDVITMNKFNIYIRHIDQNGADAPGWGFHAIFHTNDYYKNTDGADGVTYSNGAYCEGLLEARGDGSGNTREALFGPPSCGGNTNGGYIYYDLAKLFPMIDGKAIDDPTGHYTYDPLNQAANRDRRFHYTVVYDGRTLFSNGDANHVVNTYDGEGATTDAFGAGTPTGYYVCKTMHSQVAGNYFVGTSQAYPVIRYAEILLNYAEAANEYYGPNYEETLGGQKVSPYEVLKLLRKRAAIEPGDDGMYGLKPNMSQDEMREAIRLERRLELAFEGHRFFDVRRWMIADQTDNKVMHGCEITRAADGSKTWQEVEVRTHTFRKAMYFYPIPYKETVKSEDLLQNPYYE